MESVDVLIVGAGMAGLMAAGRLVEAGKSVIVLDKGRGVGGRMASRRLSADGAARADHGAQYFTCYSETFRPYVEQWLAAGLITQWSTGFYDSEKKLHDNGVPRYVGAQGMTTVPKHLAAQLDVRTGVRVASVAWAHGNFVAVTDGEEQFAATSAILTPPAEQTLALLEDGLISAETRTQLESIQFDPCFAVMAELNGPSGLPAPGGLWPVMPHAISWLADNAQKGVSIRPSVTIHASPAFTREHYDRDRDEVAALLLEAAAEWINAEVVGYSVQRWRYSIPTAGVEARCLLDQTRGNIVFAGDAFGGARVEGAALSGLAAATALLSTEQ